MSARMSMTPAPDAATTPAAVKMRTRTRDGPRIRRTAIHSGTPARLTMTNPSPSPTPRSPDHAELIEDLRDRIRAGIYGDDRMTGKQCDDALDALRELARL